MGKGISAATDSDADGEIDVVEEMVSSMGDDLEVVLAVRIGVGSDCASSGMGAIRGGSDRGTTVTSV